MNYKKTIITFGFLLAFSLTILDITMYYSGNLGKSNWSTSTIDLFLRILLICLGIHFFKKGNDGFLNLNQSVRVGIVIALIAGILELIWKVVFINIFDFSSLQANSSSKKEVIEESIWNFPYLMKIIMFFGNLILALVISLLGGAIMQKNKDIYE